MNVIPKFQLNLPHPFPNHLFVWFLSFLSSPLFFFFLLFFSCASPPFFLLPCRCKRIGKMRQILAKKDKGVVERNKRERQGSKNKRRRKKWRKRKEKTLSSCFSHVKNEFWFFAQKKSHPKGQGGPRRPPPHDQEQVKQFLSSKRSEEKKWRNARKIFSPRP